MERQLGPVAQRLMVQLMRVLRSLDCHMLENHSFQRDFFRASSELPGKGLPLFAVELLQRCLSILFELLLFIAQRLQNARANRVLRFS